MPLLWPGAWRSTQEIDLLLDAYLYPIFSESFDKTSTIISIKSTPKLILLGNKFSDIISNVGDKDGRSVMSEHTTKIKDTALHIYVGIKRKTKQLDTIRKVVHTFFPVSYRLFTGSNLEHDYQTHHWEC